MFAGANIQGLAIASTSATSSRPLRAVLLLRDTTLLRTMVGFRRIKVLKVIRLSNLRRLDSILQSLSQR